METVHSSAYVPALRKTAELKFRTPDGASVGMKLNGIEYKGHKAGAQVHMKRSKMNCDLKPCEREVTVKRPEPFTKPMDGQDPSVRINLHEMTLSSLLGVDVSQVYGQVDRWSYGFQGNAHGSGPFAQALHLQPARCHLASDVRELKS